MEIVGIIMFPMQLNVHYIYIAYCLCKSDWDRGSYKKFHHYEKLRAILASVALYLMYTETSVALYLMYRETNVALYLMYRKIFLKTPAKVNPSKD